jgi:protein-tyrosine kinase
VETVQRLAEPACLERVGARGQADVRPGALPTGLSDMRAGALPALGDARLDSLPAAVDLPRVALNREVLRGKPVVMADDPGPAANSYRMLRAQVLRRVRELSLRSIGIVSAVDGEGKTLTAVNLALSLAAEPNQTTLLLDLDLRRPNVAKTLSLQCSRGLDSWIAGNAAEEEICYGIEGMERLFIVPTLSPVIDSSAALANLHTRELLAEMKEGRFNRLPNRLLLIDLPPILLADDFLTVAPLLDAVILVTRPGRTKREDLQRVKELIGNTRLLGTVLNDSTESEKRAY